MGAVSPIQAARPSRSARPEGQPPTGGGAAREAKLIVDSFAGGGGASTGIEMALGRSPDIAINHSADALAMHQVNHPETLHLDSNIWDVSPAEVTKGRPVGLFWASPDCKHFSKAKGGKPMDRNIRDLAWVVVRWAEEAKPDVIILENVEEFVTWGPLGNDNRPIVELRGHTFEAWTRRLKKAGYKVQWRELRACDYGAPTIRKRFFMIARRDGLPIVWPKRTHGDPRKPEDAKLIARGKLRPWRTAAEIIDWSLPCPSIFDTSEEIFARFRVRAIRPLAEATMKRIARGVVRYVLEAKKPFVVNVSRAAPPPAGGWPSDGAGETSPGVRSDARPAAGAPFVTFGQHGGANRPADAPLHTVTASPKDQNAVVVPSLLPLRVNAARSQAGVCCPDAASGDASGEAVVQDERIALRDHVVSKQKCEQQRRENQTGSNRAGVHSATVAVVGTLVQTGYGEREGQAPRALDVERPVGTQVGGAAKHAVVAAHLTKFQSNSTGSSLDEPVPTVTANSYVKRPGGAAPLGVAAVHLSRFTQNGIGQGADEPVDTVMAGAPKFGVVAAFMAQHNNDSRRIGGVNPGQPADRPVATITQAGAQQSVVAAHMMRQFGASVGHGMDEPSATDTAAVNKSALIAPFLATYYGNGIGQEADGPLRTDTTKDRFGLVTVDIDGQTYAIADIGMRMLTPRERFRAQGFPDSYIIDRRPDGSGITATVQGSCCGNSVCPPLAEALVAANCGELAEIREAAE